MPQKGTAGIHHGYSITRTDDTTALPASESSIRCAAAEHLTRPAAVPDAIPSSIVDDIINQALAHSIAKSRSPSCCDICKKENAEVNCEGPWRDTRCKRVGCRATPELGRRSTGISFILCAQRAAANCDSIHTHVQPLQETVDSCTWNYETTSTRS